LIFRKHHLFFTWQLNYVQHLLTITRLSIVININWINIRIYSYFFRVFFRFESSYLWFSWKQKSGIKIWKTSFIKEKNCNVRVNLNLKLQFLTVFFLNGVCLLKSYKVSQWKIWGFFLKTDLKEKPRRNVYNAE
jgi:hypothetical protein